MANKIIDVSSNNGVIDWTKAAADGVKDVIIRLSLGYNDKDKKADGYAKDALKAGIRVSYYHLAYPDKKTGTVKGDAKQEANYFTGLFLAGKMPAPHWLAIDLENMANGWDTPLNKSEYLEWVTVFLTEVYTATGIVCLIYSNRSYLDTHLPVKHGLEKLPLWIANYNPVAYPPLPKGWTEYFLWQYSDSGKVNGISGKVDVNKTVQGVVMEGLMARVK